MLFESCNQWLLIVPGSIGQAVPGFDMAEMNMSLEHKQVVMWSMDADSTN